MPPELIDDAAALVGGPNTAHCTSLPTARKKVVAEGWGI